MKRDVSRILTRRSFLSRTSLAASAALFMPDTAMLALGRERGDLRRISQRVESHGRGLADVRVSDGHTVVVTGSDGEYTLVTGPRSEFVWISVPNRYQIPKNRTGTARFYEPLAGKREEATISFSLETGPPSDRHAFLVLADPQTQDDFEVNRLHAETVPDVVATITELPTENVFGVACGDIMYDNLSLYPRYEDAVSDMGIPFFQVVGNHDLDHEPTDSASDRTFSSLFGPRYYSFDRGEVHYVVLDNVFWFGSGYIGYLDDDQLMWMERDLQTLESGRTVVVFTHIPLLSTQFRRRGEASPGERTSVSNREILYRLLEPFDAHVMTGHTHEQEHVFEGGVHEHVHGAVCGAWWSGDICFDGTPNGYGVYEVKGSDLTWRYQATGRPDDYQIRAYAKGADPTAPDEIVANIWGWDPEWSVYWYEGGERRGVPSRRVGTDPLSERLHRGSDQPPRRPWVDPVLNRHLFYCPAPETRVTIEAVDRWGRTFVADVPSV